ncbi:hypothetical protein [Planctomycetes bacterium K23_9]|uniref:Uncharacterized protein n=1 Tax=Stieleria marina TaxID=1930275 RepID=A0A517NZC0_9BACT|nr:hypothetical protein K239x_44870 [Planctomycetes bacterium K23_9]
MTADSDSDHKGELEEAHNHDEAIAALEGTGPDDGGAAVGDEIDAARSTWAWLAVGLLAGVLGIVATQVVQSSFEVPLPAEYHELVMAADEGAPAEEANALALINRESNHSRLLLGLGATMAMVFGWAAGVISGRIPRGIVGAIAGIVLAIALAMLASPFLLDFEATVLKARENSDFYGMALHAAQWLLIGLPIALAVGIGSGRMTSSAKVAGSVVMASLLAGIIYIIGGSLIDPSARLSSATPVIGTLSYLWHIAPPTMVGLFLARSSL